MCLNGTKSSPSVCSFNGSINFAIQSGDKDPSKNAVALVYTVANSDVLLAQNNGSTNFSTWVTFPNSEGVTVTSATLDPLTNQLAVEIAYSQNLQDRDLTLEMVPPNIPQSFATTYPNHTWTVQPTNQLKAVVYTDKDYEDRNKLQIFSYFILGAYLACMSLTMVYRKFLGL